METGVIENIAWFASLQENNHCRYYTMSIISVQCELCDLRML